MNQQEIYNTVLFGLRKQGRASIAIEGNGRTLCRYRGTGGTKCAAGMLIKDENYDAFFEGRTVADSDVKQALISSGVPDTETTFILIGECQGAHDREMKDCGLKGWEARMARIARRFELDYTQPEAL